MFSLLVEWKIRLESMCKATWLSQMSFSCEMVISSWSTCFNHTSSLVWRPRAMAHMVLELLVSSWVSASSMTNLCCCLLVFFLTRRDIIATILPVDASMFPWMILFMNLSFFPLNLNFKGTTFHKPSPFSSLLCLFSLLSCLYLLVSWVLYTSWASWVFCTYWVSYIFFVAF